MPFGIGRNMWLNYHTLKILVRKNIPTKSRPIQMNQEVMEFCKSKINDLLDKGIVRKSKSP